ncbi:uncharacterized protein G2W53_015906 [Senna tora]|uniref:Uncharacterized protein n=1 Tax=Senna tora TaxID=362788 RepID=A0A834WVU0_9FABA|nr:uncharacterized protein G2W53_015906 [Senna tora]
MASIVRKATWKTVSFGDLQEKEEDERTHHGIC